ncbi:MAG: bifunctional phosphoribosyl-AMP cyclohydrolase/phosphoribosyl-ATP diphosphatase HisIE, partial [Eubacteriales bacterium]
ITALIEEIQFDEKGLVPAIAQSAETGVVLMQAFMNEEAVRKTFETGFAHYYSRSRQKLWKKGEQSGNTQKIASISMDCDYDSVLLKVHQLGPACHTGEYTCFHHAVLEGDAQEADSSAILEELYAIVSDRKANPKEGAYTTYLFEKGIDKILKKVGEETAEVIIASKIPGTDELRYEAADLLYHLTVLLCEKGLEPKEVFRELKNRHKK